MKRALRQTVFVLGLGAGLGYLAAGVRDDSPGTARAAAGPAVPAPRDDGARAEESGCSGGAARSGLLALATTGLVAQPAAPAQGGKKPNIVIIWGDDIGQSNISAYSMGLMGYRTPHIDRIAREGMIFTDYYGE